MFKWMKARKAEKARKAQWVLEVERIAQLKEGLTRLGGFPQDEARAFEYAARFFQVVSDFQDNGGIWNAPAEFNEAQSTLNNHLSNAGRCEYGINRTKRGETVTIDNTYWGDCFGLWTFTGRKWSNTESAYPGFAKQWLRQPTTYEDNPNSRKVIVDFQVKPFIDSHLPKMLKLCDTLLAA